jgi:hypothetical protein|tara:strand:- start:396 stop:653 length:258 start_codon:yes stop_codon:yes gene_type:complete
MIRPFLTITNEKLELSDLDNESSKPVVFDINADYDGSVASFSSFFSVTGLTNIATSSSIDFSDEYGIDSEMLVSFFDSVRNYEVH